jgi:protein TonB
MSISAGVAGGLLIQKTAPIYPQIAKEARVSGTVVIQAIISKTGMVENLRVVNGPTMLRQAALDAVKTWRYRPYLLSGEPVEVETTVNVAFTISGR